jgi:GNAT superfamily N-acetyltransferase
MMEPLIRPMRAADILCALTFTAREGWDIANGGFEMHLSHDPHGCFVAEVDGRVAGMITSTRYRSSAFVGNLIVEPEHRRQGIGQMMMCHAMQRVRDAGIESIHLEADPPGVNLYRSLGFIDVFESLRFQCKSPSVAGGEDHEGIRDLHADDVDMLGRYDRPTFGDDRTRLLRALLVQSPGAFVIMSDDRPSGYIITQDLPDGLRIGPWVADDDRIATVLLDEVLRRLKAPRYALGIPAVNATGVRLLEERGFIPTAPSLRMIRGDGTHEGRPEQVFAITGGDRG